MLGQEGQEDRMRLLRTVFTHWTGSSGSERALHMHMHTCPWPLHLVACYSHLIAGSMGSDVFVHLVSDNIHKRVPSQPHNHTTRMQPWICQRVQKLVCCHQNSHLVWETFLVVYQYLHTGWWVKWGRVDVVMRSNLHVLTSQTRSECGHFCGLFSPTCC